MKDAPALVVAVFSAVGSLGVAQSLPVTPAGTLTGHKIEFPAAAAGTPAVCVFGFTKEAGDATKLWMNRLSQDGINAWSIASLEHAPALVRGMIRSSMRKGTPPALLEHSLVITKDDQEWKRALGVKQDSLPMVVVLDAMGQVAWTHQGIFSEDTYRELKAELRISADR